MGRPRRDRERVVLAIDADLTEQLRAIPPGKRADTVNAALRVGLARENATS